ncbi:MAG: CusA/CzcA family heavy metal efflux RND transporter [Lewinellaceae bacterium]|nr:CusA/CzcA family heavy metal efflux RND transporter [Lewinellaceae bacterium]
MFDKIIALSIRNKVTIGAMTLALVVWGVWSATRLPIDAVPDITNNQVQVITQAPSLGAQEVEQFITAPIELALSNIPNVIEKRSISRSGISVITVVFKDATDIYWARQQVGERLKEAEAKIPAGFGDITLAPITTGLGEIYHYVIHPKPGFEDKFSATDLRTLQDWVVRTQLAGTEGLAEVSGWGGFVKQYEVALDNEKLNALGISIPEIFTALEKNNENTGGSYIEQRSNAYFIRGLGQVKNLTDIERIVVKNVAGTPVLVRDVATVQFGTATRYGAVTRNGEGEVVAGVALMLKGENFNQVIKNVKQRIAQIQKSLPEGVVIEPFIDRTELVGRSIGTVETNLIEGALIVVFVLVLFLGNLRAGLIVASAIPLSLLFALGMMRWFGVSANLMSLGAIDFGLIVDGAVIIVEAVVHRLALGKITGRLTQKQMDEQVYEAASDIRSSAAFGEIIILIVYLPLLALVGIEGKMFRPMAQTVAFAILGAFILSLTWIPMASALFLSKNTEHKRNFSDHMMDFFQKCYTPVLEFALRFKIAVVAAAIALFAISLLVFNRMGGEFIPTLEEGDLTVEISMMQGTSLSQVVETFGKAEKILKERFPEVRQVVTRIGSAEIPTDPMPVERGDLMISMKPKEKWREEVCDREEMQEAMEEALSVLPGVNIELTQPMQMRFNELMTGIRQDVAVKIYGDNLEILVQKANEVAQLISAVPGLGDPQVEKVAGLPQILVSYDREKMAQYGLAISDVNMILKTAFAGNVAGVVFEGEKRFDMVVRLRRELREDIANIENLYIPLPNGNRVPLNQVAKIEFKNAPAQVSREGGKRRIFVGFNVRGRDVESVVEEIEAILSQKLTLPPGYFTTYGGQFQNLREAKARLSVAVPAALLLILVLLYATFRSVPQALLIFTAVPLSAIGGVFALVLRGMPFSISAGVGFIALFGVAVLNGIVLIGYFNQLKNEGVSNILERVRTGTRIRLRPVIMTAAVASFGFLPMALSTSAGAEVQKPLATVVIGGLVSATLLTLLVLPALYVLFFGKKKKPRLPKAAALFVGLFLLKTMGVIAQNKAVSLDDCLALASQNNLYLKGVALETAQNRALEGTAKDLGKSNLLLTQDPTSGGNIDNSLGFFQNFALPKTYAARRAALQQQTAVSEKAVAMAQNGLVREVRLAYFNLVFFREKTRLLAQQDSLFRDFVARAELRNKTGETSFLEVLAARNRSQETLLLLKQAQSDAVVWQLELQRLTASTENLTPTDMVLPKLPAPLDPTAERSPILDFYRQKITLAAAETEVVRAENLPEFSVGYFQQLVLPWYSDARPYSKWGVGGVQFGVNVPIFNKKPFRARLQASQIGAQVAQNRLATAQNDLQSRIGQAFAETRKWQDALDFYEKTGLQQAGEILRIAQTAYSRGEIGYVEFLQNTAQALDTRLGYLDALHNYDRSVIEINHLKGQ